MKSRFNPGRIFNDPTGWFILMRESDSKNIKSMKFRRFGNQYIMGPFNTKVELSDWFEGYLAVYSDNRNTAYSPHEAVAAHTH